MTESFDVIVTRGWRSPVPHLLGTMAIVLGMLGFAASSAYAQANITAQAAAPADPPGARPGQHETYLWRPVAIGGGGFITGMDADASGTVHLARTDVYGAYLWLSAEDRWAQLVNSDSMPPALRIQDGGNEGVFEIVVAPSNPDRIYMAFKGDIYRSDNRGKKFVAVSPLTAPRRLSFDANSRWRHYGPVMAVADRRPDLVFFGSPNDGLWRSEDAGRHWSRIESVPCKPMSRSTERPGMPVWIEQSNDRSTLARVWVMSPGVGMFVSTDDGRSFKALSTEREPQPRSIKDGAFTRNAGFLGVDDIGKTVWRFQDGKWEDLAASSGLMRLSYATLAVDPDNSDVYLFDEGGKALRSSDEGNSWVSLSHQSSAGSKDPQWLHVANQSYFATGRARFDPVIAHRLWVGAGTGAYYADLKPGAREIRWISQTRGIEELVANDVLQTTGRPPLFAAWDFGIHVKPDLNAFSRTYGPKERVLIAAQQLDMTPSDPDFIVTNASDTRTFCCSGDGDAVLAGFSRNAGGSWSKFSNLPQPPGTARDDPWRMSFGTIAVSANDSRNIVWEPSHNRSPFFTKDRGVTWTRVILEGERLPKTGSHAVYSYARKTLAADRVLPSVFYLVHSGERDNAALTGLWRTENGGEKWRKVFSGEILPSSAYSAKLRAVPGRAGHLFFTSGVAQGSDLALRRSVDGGASWHVLAAITRVDDVAFGKAPIGAPYPTIFISGQVSGRYGIWRSTDEARSWRSVAEFPIGTLDQVTVIAADPNVFGRVYVGYKGSGWRYGEPSACVARPYSFPANSECFWVN
jgi:photosystem II stability/assembly factor-like uncharacterized protein